VTYPFLECGQTDKSGMRFIHELPHQLRVTIQTATHLDTQDAIKIPNSLVQFFNSSQKSLLQVFLDIDLSTILPINNKGRSICRAAPEQSTISLVQTKESWQYSLHGRTGKFLIPCRPESSFSGESAALDTVQEGCSAQRELLAVVREIEAGSFECPAWCTGLQGQLDLRWANRAAYTSRVTGPDVLMD
jgi:hypothetical protein